MEEGWKPNVEISPNCPRCGSSNTKFCYYNNYSLTQPRYFCKGCRRYWTKGGSLRNVPVGGGCRKNRRGKSLRVSTDAVPSKSLAYGSVSSGPIGHSYGSKENALVEFTSSSTMPDGSHIDLALVYANFLNQMPDSRTESQMPELPSEFYQSLEFSSVVDTNLDSRIQLPGENDHFGCLSLSNRLAETHLSNIRDVPMHFCALDLIHKDQDTVQQCTSHDTISNYALPPLPGEEVASQEILWSNSTMMMNHTLQATQLPVLGPEAQDHNLLISNWSPFDLSSGDTFSKP